MKLLTRRTYGRPGIPYGLPTGMPGWLLYHANLTSGQAGRGAGYGVTNGGDYMTWPWRSRRNATFARCRLAPFLRAARNTIASLAYHLCTRLHTFSLSHRAACRDDDERCR